MAGSVAVLRGSTAVLGSPHEYTVLMHSCGIVWPTVSKAGSPHLAAADSSGMSARSSEAQGDVAFADCRGHPWQSSESVRPGDDVLRNLLGVVARVVGDEIVDGAEIRLGRI